MAKSTYGTGCLLVNTGCEAVAPKGSRPSPPDRGIQTVYALESVAVFAPWCARDSLKLVESAQSWTGSPSGRLRVYTPAFSGLFAPIGGDARGVIAGLPDMRLAHLPGDLGRPPSRRGYL